MATKLFLSLCLAFCVLIVSLEGVYASKKPAGAKKGLTLFEANRNKVRGSYRSSSAHIRFSSESNDRHTLVSVAGFSGNPLFIFQKPRRSAVMTMSVGDEKFVSEMNEPDSGLPRYSDYVVPQVFHKLVQFATKQGVSSSLIPLLRSYSHEHDVNATRRRAVENIISHGQADAIIEAAKAMGEAGVMGYESPAALQFYALAMRLDGARERMQAQEEETNIQNFLRSVTSQRVRGRRHVIDDDLSQVVLSESASCPKCTTGRCPYMGDKNNDCNGMCGRKCSCWSYVCGDCCVHQGCLIHDNCCARDGYLSIACLNVFNFKCDSYSC